MEWVDSPRRGRDGRRLGSRPTRGHRLSPTRPANARAHARGMRRRLALACAIVAQPQLLLLDEPTVGLDPEQRSGLRDLIHATAKDCAVVFSTHELGEVDFFDPAVAVIDQGLMVFTGTAQQLRAGALEDASPAVRLERRRVPLRRPGRRDMRKASMSFNSRHPQPGRRSRMPRFASPQRAPRPAQTLASGRTPRPPAASCTSSVCCLGHRRGRGRSGSGYGPGAALGGARESLIGPDVFGFGLRLAGPCQNTR